jgi:hypothetical protein
MNPPDGACLENQSSEPFPPFPSEDKVSSPSAHARIDYRLLKTRPSEKYRCRAKGKGGIVDELTEVLPALGKIRMSWLSMF